MKLANYVADKWVEGSGPGTPLVDPVTGDALARIASTIEQSPILILSDINMPGMTGLEMLPKI